MGKLASSGLMIQNMLLANTIGMSILKDAFQCAAHFMANGTSSYPASSIYSTEEGSAALAYITGTGLNMTIARFGLDLNPDVLRDNFFFMVSRYGRLDSRVRSSFWLE